MKTLKGKLIKKYLGVAHESAVVVRLMNDGSAIIYTYPDGMWVDEVAADELDKYVELDTDDSELVEERRRIHAIGKKALDLFCELRDLCYADDIVEFDRLHDDLYYQAVGINESLSMFRQDVRDGSDITGWEKEFNDALTLAKSIKKFHKNLKKTSSMDFEWIYG